MRTPRVAVAATLMTLTLLTACGDGDDDSESGEEVTATVTVTPSETTSAPTETTTAPSTPVTPMDPTEGGDVTMEQVEAALLTPEEVGPDFTLGAYTEESSPPLCDPEGTPVDEQIPPQVEAGTQVDHSSGDAAMQETISIYSTEAEASEAFALASAGLACTDGSTDGTPVTIGPAQDVTADVNSESGLGTSTAWEVTAESFNGVVVATLAGRIILATQFASAPQFDTSTLPNPVDVATAAFAKALAN